MEREGEHGKVPRSSGHWARDSALTSPQRRGRGCPTCCTCCTWQGTRILLIAPAADPYQWQYPLPLPLPPSPSPSLPSPYPSPPPANTVPRCQWPARRVSARGVGGGVRSHGSMRTWDAHAAASTHEFRVESGERARAQGEEKIGRG